MDVANGASAAEFQAALMSITWDASSSDGSRKALSVSVDRTSTDSGVEWRITFLSHLEVSGLLTSLGACMNFAGGNELKCVERF